MHTLLLLCVLVPDAGAPPKRVAAPRPDPMTPPWNTPGWDEQPGQHATDFWNPKLPGIERFPNKECCDQMVSYLEKLGTSIEGKLLWADRIGNREEAARLQLWKEDVCTVLAAWRLLHWIRTPYSGSDEDKERMKELHKLLGDAAWWRGEMPSPNLQFFAGY